MFFADTEIVWKVKLADSQPILIFFCHALHMAFVTLFSHTLWTFLMADILLVIWLPVTHGCSKQGGRWEKTTQDAVLLSTAHTRLPTRCLALLCTRGIYSDLLIMTWPDDQTQLIIFGGQSSGASRSIFHKSQKLKWQIIQSSVQVMYYSLCFTSEQTLQIHVLKWGRITSTACWTAY